MPLEQGLPFHSTIVQREFTRIAYVFLFSWRSDCGELWAHIKEQRSMIDGSTTSMFSSIIFQKWPKMLFLGVPTPFLWRIWKFVNSDSCLERKMPPKTPGAILFAQKSSINRAVLSQQHSMVSLKLEILVVQDMSALVV